MIEEELFNKAVALRGEDRVAFLDEACAGDSALRAAVEGLLRADEEASGYLEPHGLGLEQTEQTASPSEHAGQVVAGRYKLLEQIGEGGMGAVWVAEQREPVKRQVALKLVKPGMDSKAVLARFEAERQALALMEHSNIAKVLDGGVTQQGRPFFVMELVKGMPLTEYCDARRLNVRERLHLFVQICSAVQHAHQKGIIHRDLKPSNILVTEHDGRPVPKVIDFGLAKALSTATTLTERTLHTAYGTVVGTPLYMAPEQVAVNALDVDTRSDIYSLGVILYELLTGTTPLEKQRFKEAAWDEIRRVIREEEPPKPSLRLSDSHDSLPSISAHRHTEPAALTRLVRGELDWIVMKALEKDRNRRYETANGFAMDVQRYLADEPVQACPPSTVYQFKKFVRRNKRSVIAASMLFVALLAGVVGTSWGLAQAKAAATRESKAREQSDANFALAVNSVKKFLMHVTDDPDLKEAGLHQLRKKLVTSAVPFFETVVNQKSDDPKLQTSRATAFLQLTLLHQALGDYEAALQHSEATRDIFAKLHAVDPKAVQYRHGLANGLHNRALSLAQLGKRDEAEAGYRQAISILEQLVADSPGEDQRKDLAHGYSDLGLLLRRIGKRHEAETATRQKLTVFEELARDFPGQPEYLLSQASAHNALGLHFIELGKFEEGEKALRRSIALYKNIAKSFPNRPTDWDEAGPLLNLSVMFNSQGKFQEAQEPIRQAVETQEKLSSQYPASPAVRDRLSHFLSQQGILFDQQGKHHEAAAAFRRALGIRERLAEEFPKLPEYQQRVSETLMSLGNTLTNMRKFGEAEPLIRRALDYYERLVREHPENLEHAVSLGGMYCNLGSFKVDAGDPKAALGLLDQAIDRLEKVLANEPQLLQAKEFLGNSFGHKANALNLLGRRAEVVDYRERHFALFKELYGPAHKATLEFMWSLIQTYDAVKRFDDALRLRREMLDVRRQALGPDHAETLGAMANVAHGHENLGDHREAIKLRQQVLALMKEKIPNDDYTLKTMCALAGSYDAVSQPADAKKTRDEAIAFVRKRLSSGDPSALSGVGDVAKSFIDAGRDAEAIALIDDAVRTMAGKSIDSGAIVDLLDLRLRHFAKKRDPAGVRGTAEHLERLEFKDPAGLYAVAYFRAVVAGVVRDAGGPDAAKHAAAESDRGMEQLRGAVAAGYRNVRHMKEDPDLKPLQNRDDFKRLIADLEAKNK
jgi:serine/threonine protein kinase/tetratricopeptide (TPR) repeat protein